MPYVHVLNISSKFKRRKVNVVCMCVNSKEPNKSWTYIFNLFDLPETRCHRRIEKFTLEVNREPPMTSYCENSLPKERTRGRQAISYRQNTCRGLFVVGEITVLLFHDRDYFVSRHMSPGHMTSRYSFQSSFNSEGFFRCLRVMSCS